ncbi:lymphocyte antigen 75-like isoform X1 [Scleropages formosus]|uniref:lymphocyte antigen 75-like isoform X1 n=1 Tax=Scleropages formosus TaxID=113540 RepID=UPI0010FA8C5C|nr:lymphocyte antigen 75-like isoform X1 [Scleropages formosus]
MRKAALYCVCLGLVAVLTGRSSAGQSGDDTFSVEHRGSGRCLVADGQQLRLAECAAADLWKWVSGHRLFHVSSGRCLGLEVRSKALRLLDCAPAGDVLWWRCADGVVYTAYQMCLAVVNGTVGAKRDSTDRWSVCERSYQVVHTTLGNSYGAPCYFPFRYNGSWFHECLPDDSDDAAPGLSWCSTTQDFDADGKRGYCLKPETGCGPLWSEKPRQGYCYQLNLRSTVNWHTALASCRSQRAELLSIAGIEELGLFKDRSDLPAQVWIGLEQLDEARGWRWADSSPLAFVRWESGMPNTNVFSAAECAVMNPRGFWKSVLCDKSLPYICKKSLNGSEAESPGLWVNQSTKCASGWAPWNGFCFKLEKERRLAMADAQQRCRTLGAELVSVHSLAQVEAISTAFHADGASDVWTGLKSEGEPVLFRWVDRSPVSFTYWARNEPHPLPGNNASCVSYSGEFHLWRVTPCDEKLSFLCAKEGDVNDTAVATGCPAGKEWKRHGNACYKVDPREVLFKDRCNLSITNRFEQAFINSLIREQATAVTSYFWTGLQDSKNVGEYQWMTTEGPGDRVTFTNWNIYEPALAGGCAVMTTGKTPGKWEVKNCTSFKAGSVCKVDAGPRVPPEPEPDLGQPCAPGWVSADNIRYCYKVFHEERLSRTRTWVEAEHFCQALGAHLPSFRHVEEMDALHSFLRNTISNDRYFWVGLNQRNPGAEGSWEWSDGRPVSSSVFPREFHEDDEYNRDCVAFKSERRTLRTFFMLLFDLPLRSFFASPFHCDARLEWVCQIPRGKTPETPEWYNPGGHHETSVFVDGTEFWFVNDTRLGYEEAQLYCSNNESKLARPNSILAFKQILETIFKIADSTQSWWVDVDESEQNFRPRWPPAMTHEPNFPGTCTSLSIRSIIPEYRYSCETLLPFLCEKLNLTALEKQPALPHPPGRPCGNDSLAFRDKCYRLFKPRHMTFSQANEHCQTMGGTLLTVSSQVEQDFITWALSNRSQKSWIGLKMKPQEMEWVDGSPVTFLNFNPLLLGQVRPLLIHVLDPGSMELCGYMFTERSALIGTWDYMPCRESQYASACQYYADKSEETFIPEGNFTMGEHTYLVVQGNMTWLEALEQCKNKGMELTSVSDAFQQAALTVTVSKANTSLWIGLYSLDDGIHYQWTDGSHTVFSRWSPEPTSGEYVYLDADGFWKAADSEEELAGAICHVPRNQSNGESRDVVAKCPHKGSGPNWIPFRNNCYTFQLASSRWDDLDKDVRNTCAKFDPKANILTIRDEKENEFVTEQLWPFRDLAQYVWLGMVKGDGANSLKWYDDTYVQFSKWRAGRPNVTQRFMAGLRLDGLWEFFSNPQLFSLFKERSIVVCKIENGSKEEYRKSAGDAVIVGNWSYQGIKGRMTWMEAARACKSAGAHLASIHSSNQDDRVKLVPQRDGFPLWIGFSSQDGGLSMEWSDGTTVDYKPEGFLSSNSSGDCFMLSPSGSWDRMDCQAKLEGAICYNSSTERSSPLSTPQDNGCPQGTGTARWIQYEGHCYAFDMAFFNYSVYSMEDAKAICGALDKSAELLVVNSGEENDFVSKNVAQNPFITGRVWLDVQLNRQAGQSTEYSNWEKGSTLRSPADPACAVLLSTKGGAWDRVSCRDARSRVVCKAPARSEGSPAALILFLIVTFLLLGVVAFIVYRKNRSRFSSTVRYKRNFDEADSTSIITQTE